MSELECPGLPASWFNAWLAAVGTTVLVPELRLSWTDSATPTAVLRLEGHEDPIDALHAAWPTRERIGEMPLASEWRGLSPFRAEMPLADFRERARGSRACRDHWSLSSTYTDLYVVADAKGQASAGRSKLAPAAPGSNGTVHDRLCRVHGLMPVEKEHLSDSFGGLARRVQGNGLGFDVTRISAQGDSSQLWKKRVDPVIEVLAFFGLAMFPVRGSGVIARGTDRLRHRDLRQRSWLSKTGVEQRRLVWPAWIAPLRRHAIDALMDAWDPRSKRSWASLGICSAWQSSEFIWQGNDQTRGIGSEAL